MKKGLALIAMLLAVLMLSGCNLIGYDEALDGAQVVAQVNDTEITKAEWLSYRDYLASYYDQYYQQYFGMTMPLTEEALAAYGEEALEGMIETIVVQDKIKEYGLDPLDDEQAADVETYADTMMSIYKSIMRMQNYPDLETVEEETARLSAAAQAKTEATPSEATAAQIDPEQLTATVSDAELDAMLESDLAALGYTREYFVQSQTASLQNDLLREEVIKDVAITDEEIQTEFDSRAESQKASYDATPTLYAGALNNGSNVYYTPEGYRGVKNLLITISDEDQSTINELTATLSTAQNAQSNAQSQLDSLAEEDTSDYDEEALAAYNEQIAGLTEQVTAATQTIEETQAALDETTEAAFAAILPTAQELLERAQAGEDFDALIAEFGDDPGMEQEPAVTRGYLVCEGLGLYVSEFQDAAMALENIGDISDLVKTSYGYHILKYETDIEPGVVELTEELAEDIRSEMLAEAQQAAYEAAVHQWVSDANVKTFPKVME